MKKRLILLSIIVLLLDSCTRVQKVQQEAKVLGVVGTLGLVAASMAHQCNAEIETKTTVEEKSDGTKITTKHTKRHLGTDTKGSVGKKEDKKKNT